MSKTEFENTSGQGRKAIVPPGVRGLNWGAFLLSWIWAFHHRLRSSLLFFIPPLWFVFPFVYLFKGNEWAWKRQRWKSVAHFQEVQRRWSKWAIILVASLPVALPAFAVFIIFLLKYPAYYEKVVAQLQRDERVITALGTSVEPKWWVEGSADLNSALIQIPLTGSKSDGSACFYAEKISGTWQIKGLLLFVESTGEETILVPFQTPGAYSRPLGWDYCSN